MPTMLRIAHRGASGTRPELTMGAFERALDIGVDMIELDVQLTRDRKLVVLHDRDLGRTVAGRGAVRDRSLAELQQLDAGSWFAPEYSGARVPSLAQVLDLVRGRAALNVEIKSPAADWDETADALLESLAAADLATTIVSSFAMGALRAVRERSAAARIGVLWHEPDIHNAFGHADRLAAEALHPLHRLVTARLVERARGAGLAVYTWTVNDVARMRALADLGVDGIISDFPERFASLEL
jgi:glycerophosphoryl diester phosphodiesterase